MAKVEREEKNRRILALLLSVVVFLVLLSILIIKIKN